MLALEMQHSTTWPNHTDSGSVQPHLQLKASPRPVQLPLLKVKHGPIGTYKTITSAMAALRPAVQPPVQAPVFTQHVLLMARTVS